MEPSELLARADLFRALDAEAMASLVAEVRAITLSRNEMVFAEGDEAAELYVVRSGRIAIAIRSPDGRESVVGLVRQARLDALAQLERLGPELDDRLGALAALRLEEVDRRLRTLDP